MTNFKGTVKKETTGKAGRSLSRSRSGKAGRSLSRSRSGKAGRSLSRSRSGKAGRSLSRSRAGKAGRSLSRSRSGKSGRSTQGKRATSNAETVETVVTEDKPAASAPLTRTIVTQKTDEQREAQRAIDENIVRNILFDAPEGIIFISDGMYYIEPKQKWIKNNLKFLDVDDDNKMLKHFIKKKGRGAPVFVEVKNGKIGYATIADDNMLSDSDIKHCETLVKECEKKKVLSKKCRNTILKCNNAKRVLNSGVVIPYDGRAKSMDIKARQLNPFGRKLL